MRQRVWNQREGLGVTILTEMVTGVCRCPRNGMLRFGQPGGSLVKLGEGKTRGGLGLLIGAGMRRKGQEIARLKRGVASMRAGVTRGDFVRGRRR
jgi:hypothetical protein